MRSRHLRRFRQRQPVTDNHRRDRQISARQTLCDERQDHGCGFRSFLRCARSTGRTGRQEVPDIRIRRQPRYRQPHAGCPQRRHRQLLDPQSEGGIRLGRRKGHPQKLGIDGDYEGIGHCVLGYTDGPQPEAAPRKEGRVYHV